MPALISNIEIAWEHELIRRTLERWCKFMICVMFDRRGIGLSDRFDGNPNLKEHIEDMVFVMDAVGWKQAQLQGTSEGGLMATMPTMPRMRGAATAATDDQAASNVADCGPPG